MSMSGLDVLDKSLQTTNIWLDEIMEDLGPDRQRAYHALGAVLQALRDRLPVDEAAHLAAQLPIIIRGIYFHSWNPSHQPSKERTAEEFLNHVQENLKNIRPLDVGGATRTVFKVLEKHISSGESEEIKQVLPKGIRQLWNHNPEQKNS